MLKLDLKIYLRGELPLKLWILQSVWELCQSSQPFSTSQQLTAKSEGNGPNGNLVRLRDFLAIVPTRLFVSRLSWPEITLRICTFAGICETGNFSADNFLLLRLKTFVLVAKSVFGISVSRWYNHAFQFYWSQINFSFSNCFHKLLFSFRGTMESTIVEHKGDFRAFLSIPFKFGRVEILWHFCASRFLSLQPVCGPCVMASKLEHV